MQRLLLLFIYPLGFLLFFACVTSEKADSIYFGGDILTMEDEQRQVEALAIKAGKILALGDFSDIEKRRASDTEMIDLAGKTLLPGFVDAHSHLTIGMQMVRQANLTSPPVGTVKDIVSLISTLEAHKEKYSIQPGTWLTGWGYDPDQLAEGRHPTKEDLDAFFPDMPVFLLHVSAHMAVVNSKAMEIAGISSATPDPENGVIVRKTNSSEPTGLLQEKAMYLVLGRLPQPDPEEAIVLLKETLDFYASRGITTAQDGLTDFTSFQFLSQAAANIDFPIDIEALASYRDIEKYWEADSNRFGKNINRLRLAGIKVVGDGSPQGKTAFFSQPYQTAVPGCEGDCRGVPTVSQEELNTYLKTGYEKGIQMYVHCNGDASIDMLLEGHEKVSEELAQVKDIQRTVIIHSQFVRKDQLEKYASYNMVPSFFTNHAFFWGDVHRRNLGEERADFLSPLRSASDMGITFTNHTDYIVTPLNQLFLLWTAVNRQSRSGAIIGPNEKIDPWQGLKAFTINAAYQHQTEATKGSLKKGKLADLVILDKNPLTVEPTEIKEIQVLKTIKEGKVIFAKER